jgi:hypothetical protein
MIMTKKRKEKEKEKGNLTFPAASNVPINVAITAHEASPTGNDRAAFVVPGVEGAKTRGKVGTRQLEA